MAKEIEIYNANDLEDWNYMQEKIYTSLFDRDLYTSYATKKLNNRDGSEIGLIIDVKWKEEIIELMTEEEQSKLLIIIKETHPSYYDVETKQ
jgi:hypothetical protein